MRRPGSVLVVFVSALLAVSCGGKSSKPRGPGADGRVADQALPVDPAVRIGKLRNGLTYYVRKHSVPPGRAMLWLAVDVGSIQEDDDQLGLAHFVEHMAFNGTRRFAKQQIIDFMERIGMRFGPHVNAETAWDHTIYKLQVPTSDRAVVDSGLRVLRDWADGVAFEDEEIEKERGVVLEERRAGLGAEIRLLEKLLPVVFGNSRYATRLPIGKKEVLEKAPGDALRRFYRDWYRPDLMAVIAVGDFDPLQMEAQIQEQFGDLAAPARPRPPVAGEVPDFAGTRIAIESDPELPVAAVAIVNKLPRRPLKTRSDLRRAIVELLYHQMLNARLAELRQQADPPFLFAVSTSENVVRAADAFIRAAVVKKDEVARGLDALATEVERIERHGFVQSELDRARGELLRVAQRSAEERDKVDAGELVDEIIDYHLEGVAMPGAATELQLFEEMLPGIDLAEIDRAARAWGGNNSRIVVVVGPAGAKLPDRAGVLAAIDAVKKKDIPAYLDDVAAMPLLAKPPAPGEIIGRSKIAELGVTEWTLANGARVILKPTTFKKDEILLAGISFGGSSQVSDADFPSARFAAEIVSAGGLGEQNTVQLTKTLSGKIASASVAIGELDERVSGRASPRDVETMFQLVHLSFTMPRKDDEAFQSWRVGNDEVVANRLASPAAVFEDAMQLALYQRHARRQPLTKQLLDRVHLDRAIEIYRQRFGDAGDFTFAIVGNFTPESIEPLVKTYLASLPSAGRKEKWKDIGVKRPGKVEKVRVNKGIEDRSSVRLVFSGKARWSIQAEHDIESLAQALAIRLREQLREEMGGVYGVGVDGAVAKIPREEYTFAISFVCAPANVDRLVEAVFAEIQAFKKAGPAKQYAQKVREAQTRTRETSLEDNDFWLDELLGHYHHGLDPRSILGYAKLVDSVTPERIRHAAKQYLGTTRYVLGVLDPENAAGKTARP